MQFASAHVTILPGEIYELRYLGAPLSVSNFVYRGITEGEKIPIGATLDMKETLEVWSTPCL